MKDNARALPCAPTHHQLQARAQIVLKEDDVRGWRRERGEEPVHTVQFSHGVKV
jgi:hypothetical protein